MEDDKEHSQKARRATETKNNRQTVRWKKAQRHLDRDRHPTKATAAASS